MRIIKQLPKQIADKIAAGEVVTAPLSVVKELVENSIDAGAAQIIVEIENGGKTYLRVTDDGAGISAEDVRFAFTPHATSKISEESDLDSIGTLGFRGEALSSIAAVSRLEMITKTREEKTAQRIIMEGGEFIGSEPTGAPDGTSVTVRDLFYNTPARLKFMKSDRSETTKIVDLMSRISVAYPDKKIRVSTNGTVLFSTPGKGDRLRTILTVFGVSAGEDLIPVDTSASGADKGASHRLLAWISDPNHSVKTRRNQVFFVNGRYVKDDVISGAVADAYKEFMFESRYPLVYAFLETDPSRVDVNVHPTKSEIKFADAASVRNFVKDAIVAALTSKAGVPKAHTAQQFASAKRAERAFYKLRADDSDKEGAGSGRFAGTPQNTSEASGRFAGTPQNTREASGRGGRMPQDAQETPGQSGGFAQNAGRASTRGGKAPQDGAGDYADVVNIKDLYGGDAVPAPTGEIHEQEDSAYVPGAATEHPQQPSSETVRTASSGDSPDQQELRIDYLQVLGSVFGSYILAADEDSLYLVDWHAAHERVNYEKLMEGYRSGEKLSQALLTPEVLNLPATARQYTDDWAVWLTAAGFGAEVFGENALIVKSVPAFIGAGEALRFVNDIIESGGNSPPVGDQAVERLISRACRSSVKANAHIREEEARALLQRLAECANPYTCPHGRPVFIRYTKYDLEKLFKRT